MTRLMIVVILTAAPGFGRINQNCRRRGGGLGSEGPLRQFQIPDGWGLRKSRLDNRLRMAGDDANGGFVENGDPACNCFRLATILEKLSQAEDALGFFKVEASRM